MTTLLQKLEFEFQNPEWLLRALTHKSFHNENAKESTGHNERLEFLGDAVLDLVLSEYLFLEKSELSEGDLSKIRASLVNEKVLAEITQEYGIHEQIRFGKGELRTGGVLKPRLLACAFEALIGAIYLDSGYEPAKKIILKAFGSRLKKVGTGEHFAEDFKTRLQELTQREHRSTPVYELVAEDGPDHDKSFRVQVSVDENALAEGEGRSKKQAEQAAAEKALEVLK